MKTLTYLTTLLALSIQVMVNGQTQGNQARKILVDIMGAKEPVKMNYTNSNITLSITEYNQLIEQAKQLKIGAQKLREEAELTEQNYLIKQIEASQLSEKITYQKFEENKKAILVFYTKTPKTHTVISKANLANNESERFMKLAKEIREDADAQLTLQAKIGSMSNAEEKEALALSKQQEVLAMFEALKLTSEKNMTEQHLVINQEKVTVNQEQLSDQKTESLMALLFEALTQADNMKTTSQSLRETALTASVNEKNILINEALSLEKECVAKKVEISNLKSILTYKKFIQNRLIIDELINNVKDNVDVVNYVNQLNQDAERLMKIGKEMREEANAQLTILAKYGAMSNAEESEALAVSKQHESIQLIEKSNSKMVIASR